MHIEGIGAEHPEEGAHHLQLFERLGQVGVVRVAFEVPDTATATRDLVDAGANLIAEPTVTPWRSVNSRLEGPAQLKLTLFSSEDGDQ